MKVGTLLLIGLAGFAAIEFLNLGTAVATVQFVFSGVTVNNPLSYNIQILVQNVSNASCTLSALTGAVTVNDNPIGTISDFTAVVIPPTSQQTINVNLAVSALSLPSSIIDLVNNSGGDLDFNVTGNANVNGLVLPFSLDKSVAA